jgi:hypothetical protein
MAKRLVIKTGSYMKDGQEKGEYTRVGVMMDGDNGPYLLLDPCVNLAGCLTKQNMMNHKSGKQVRDSLLVSVFEDDNQHQRPQQGQQPTQQRQQAQGGYDQQFENEPPF